MKEVPHTEEETWTDLPLLGRTLSAVEVDPTLHQIRFTLTDGTKYLMYHEQDCCESVEIEDICGDVQDLVGEPLLQAEEYSRSGGDADLEETETYTFYRFATLKGVVTIRWYGTSNGYYSEAVDLIEVSDWYKGIN